MVERRLGRGLGSLLASSPAREAIRGMKEAAVPEGVHEVPLDSIYPNQHQPRQTFDLETIEELARSMEAVGLLSPILVRPDEDGRYELIAGERRWRAATTLGWKTIRAFVRSASEHERLEIALIENVQREDLNPIDRALAYQELVGSFGLTHEEVGRRIGKSRSSLTNLLRLLDLSEDLRDMVRDGELSAGHARALLAIEDEEERREVADAVQIDGLSVRAVERLVQQRKQRPPQARKAREKARPETRSPQVLAMEEKIARHLGTKVRIYPRGSGGRICVEYFSTDDFERILGQMGAG